MMKKIIFILLFSIVTVSMAQAQVFKILKTKAKTAVDNSVDRSTSKVVDKTINNTADNVTDSVLNKAGKKMQSLFKKKNKKNKNNEPEQPAVPVSDSAVNKPQGQN